MRLDFAPDSLVERAGLALGKVPLPVGRAFFGMPAARGVGVAQRIGVFAALAESAHDAPSLAASLGVRERPLRMLLDLLAGERVLRCEDGDYSLSGAGRRWLDPASPTYVGTFVEHSLDYWEWWGRLEDVLHGEQGSMQDHGLPAGDPAWATYIRGQYELARLSADEVARAIDLPAGADSILDVAGGHGWFAAAICRRRPGLRATVLDLPGSAAVGRQIIAEAGMAEAVTHVEGDILRDELGGPYDGALAFSIVHHLDSAGRDRLLSRIRAALEPGGTVAILDMFRPGPHERRIASAAAFQLFFHLTSGSDVLSEGELREHLRRNGFSTPRRRNIRSIPDYRLYTARAL
jgi:SAM-dependent methyltransferase